MDLEGSNPNAAVAALSASRYDQLCAQISQEVADILGIETSTVTPASTLFDLGAQSFDFVDLVFRLERNFNIAMPRTYLVPDAYTIDTLVRAVAKEVDAPQQPPQ